MSNSQTSEVSLNVVHHQLETISCTPTEHCCCGESHASKRAATAAKTLGRRSCEFAEWAIPGALLAFMPKCPACLAAYVAIGIGVGLSVSVASYLRLFLLIVCLASLSYLAATRTRHVIHRIWKLPQEGSVRDVGG